MNTLIDELDNSKQHGLFSISSLEEIPGELFLSGSQTHLSIRRAFDADDEGVSSKDEIPNSIKGELNDLTKVTLYGCIRNGTLRRPRGRKIYVYTNIFPHFVLYGDVHINPSEEIISEANFCIDDSSAIFGDDDAFGTLLNPQPILENAFKAETVGEQRNIGANSHLFYYTGKEEIFSADTCVGRISASHRISFSAPDVSGIHLKNKVLISILFKEACYFD
ncbi:MAG: hypothetical protein AAGC93_14125 [Cyanobacteria bacterium P01_F01_bin.53]